MKKIQLLEFTLRNGSYIVDGQLGDNAIKFLGDASTDIAYVAMIDWERYDLNNLLLYDGKSIDAIRIVFPCRASCLITNRSFDGFVSERRVA